jgi:hypothetical protein
MFNGAQSRLSTVIVNFNSRTVDCCVGRFDMVSFADSRTMSTPMILLLNSLDIV